MVPWCKNIRKLQECQQKTPLQTHGKGRRPDHQMKHPESCLTFASPVCHNPQPYRPSSINTNPLKAHRANSEPQTLPSAHTASSNYQAWSCQRYRKNYAVHSTESRWPFSEWKIRRKLSNSPKHACNLRGNLAPIVYSHTYRIFCDTHLLRTVIANSDVECILRAKTLQLYLTGMGRWKDPRKNHKGTVAIASARCNKLEVGPSL